MSVYGDLMNLSKAPNANPLEPKLPTKDQGASPIATTAKPTRAIRKSKEEPVILRHHDTTTTSMVSRHQDTKRDTMTPRYHDDTIELIRSAVKTFGKEAATHRFTLEEKKAIIDIVYTYKTQGVKTTENEVARIAINFVVSDYQENGKNSVLSMALKALNR